MLNITLEQLNALTASEALQAMVDGLLENAADPMWDDRDVKHFTGCQCLNGS